MRGADSNIRAARDRPLPARVGSLSGERFDPAVRIVEHDPRWAGEAAAELLRLGEALGPLALRLEHIGSTAVPGLAAKPIIDLLVSVVALEPRGAHGEPLERLGYLFVPEAGSPDRQFFARPAKRPRSHHVHVCAVGSRCERRHLAVRDFLRSHPDEAAAYGSFKRGLAERHPGDRLAYIAGKDDYVVALEARALEWIGLDALAAWGPYEGARQPRGR